ncbi:DNA recombination protein RmuC [Flavobacteriaceae bacterium 3519-10]|nr:DNA recombination protein RmuC [Flavobacteriaceae bacterium 3519-10]
METTSLIIGLFAGAIVGAVILYFVLKSAHVPRKLYDDLNGNFIRNHSELQNSTLKISDLDNFLKTEKQINQQQTELLNTLKNEMATLSAEHATLQNQFREQRELNAKQSLQIDGIRSEKEEIFGRNAELAAINESLQQSLKNQKEEIEKIQETAKNEFKNLANEILEEKSKKFTDANKENLDILLKPLGENLETFKKRVNEVYDNEARERFSLNNTIKLMMEQTTKVSQEANNLATALKGQTKTQGNWGEMILERILEDSGLCKDREYFSQYNIKTETGENQRPDFVLKLPGNQIVIIDSKVSLNAYERMCSAETEDERKQNLSLHIAAIKKHIDTLALKRYDNLKEALDFTIMFIPVEPAFLTAVQYDQQLWNYAYHKHIILLSPTNLIAYLKLISDVWKRADQNQNAEEIARQAAALYDKFEGFVSDLLNVGKKMEGAKQDYESAMKKLSTGNGNLVKATEKLRQLGVKPKKQLPNQLLERANVEEIDFANDESVTEND